MAYAATSTESYINLVISPIALAGAIVEAIEDGILTLDLPNQTGTSGVQIAERDVRCVAMYRSEVPKFRAALEGCSPPTQEDVNRARRVCGYRIPVRPDEPDAGIDALVRWRNDCSLDWYGDELVLHVLGTLDQFPAMMVPEQHRDALARYRDLSDENREAIVRRVLDESAAKHGIDLRGKPS